MGNLVVQAFLKYIESNPAVLEKLIGQLVPAIVEAILSNLQKAQGA